MIDPTMRRRIALGVVVLLIMGAIIVIEAPWKEKSSVDAAPQDIPEWAKEFPGAPNFKSATGWINGTQDRPVELVALRGKVVLVDFWTYSCINCIRTFPYLRAWDDHYGGEGGLQIVGVHSPEFRFERDKDNVRDATQKYGLDWPTALDNDFGIWGAYNNRYWPAKYLVDQYGRIRHSHFGEGGYRETEEQIRILLAQANYTVPADYVQVDANIGPGGFVTPELYAAGGRNAIANPEGYHEGANITYAEPGTYPTHKISLVGRWHNGAESMTALGDGGAVQVPFRSGGANFVAGGLMNVCVPIQLDGADVPSALRGKDVRVQSGGTCVLIDGSRSYDVYAGTVEEHRITLRPPRGFELYTFAFSDSRTTT
jgi:thiol-disulfide isomerase/thioredoxin